MKHLLATSFLVTLVVVLVLVSPAAWKALSTKRVRIYHGHAEPGNGRPGSTSLDGMGLRSENAAAGILDFSPPPPSHPPLWQELGVTEFGAVDRWGDFAGRPHGAYAAATRDGIVLIRGQYVNGRRDGIWRFQDPFQTVQELIEYEAGQLLQYTIVPNRPVPFPLSEAVDRYDEFPYLERGILGDGAWHGNRLRLHRTPREALVQPSKRGTSPWFQLTDYARDGVWVFVLGSGLVEKVGRYEDYVEQGWWTFYDEQGRIEQQDFYEGGRIQLGRQRRSPPWAAGMRDQQ